jgi:ribosomal protein L21E
VGTNHKEFKEGDRVVIAEVGSIHQGQHGEVVYVGHGSRETDYIVKLDKESRGSKQVRVTVPKGSKVTFLMKL